MNPTDAALKMWHERTDAKLFKSYLYRPETADAKPFTSPFQSRSQLPPFAPDSSTLQSEAGKDVQSIQARISTAAINVPGGGAARLDRQPAIEFESKSSDDAAMSAKSLNSSDNSAQSTIAASPQPKLN